MPKRERINPSTVQQWALDAEHDLDGLNSLRLRKCAGTIATLTGERQRSDDHVNRLLFENDKLRLQLAGYTVAHRVI